jgi:hypothetical protein
MLLIAVAAVAAAGYASWQYFKSEQAADQQLQTPVEQPSTQQVIDQLEQRPVWNGPGVPAANIGDGVASNLP